MAIALAAAVALAVVVVAGVFLLTYQRPAAIDPSPSAMPSGTIEPGESPETTVPSPESTAGTGELPTGPSDAVMSFTAACDVVPPVNVPSTTVLTDGRVILSDDAGRLLVRQLTPASLDDLREQVRSSGLFDASADYRLERRPGAPEPPGHGLCVWGFTWNDGGEDVVVSSIMWLGDEEESTYYEPAPERRTLDELATQLQDPTTWYDDDGWVQPEAAPFEPDEYIVLTAMTVPQAATQGAPDFEEVSWPFDEPPDEFGVEYGSGDPPSRCDVAGADAVQAMAAELSAAGLEQFDQAPFYGVGASLPWEARDAAVDVAFWPVLPDGRPQCQGIGD